MFSPLKEQRKGLSTTSVRNFSYQSSALPHLRPKGDNSVNEQLSINKIEQAH